MPLLSCKAVIFQMDFFHSFPKIRILAVLKPSWDAIDKTVAPRGYCALSFRADSEATFTVRDKVFAVGRGDVLYMPPNTPYRLKSDGESIVAIDFIADTDHTLPEIHTARDTVLTASLFESAYRIWTEKRPGYYNRVASIFYKLLAVIEEEEADSLLSSKNERIRAALDMIHSGYSNPSLTVPALADACGISDTYLRLIFKETYGITPLIYLNRLRLERAAELLKSGRYSVLSAAEMTGFSDSKYFSTAFKKHFGISPSECRDTEIGSKEQYLL